jgi:molybdate transport system substrate-binding protein
VLTKVLLGEADAGLVYASDAAARTAHGAGQPVNVIDIPDALNVVAEYPLAVIADSAHAVDAAAFVDFLLSSAGQGILLDFGFQPIADGAD